MFINCQHALYYIGASVEIPDQMGQTPIYYAICPEWLEMIELLISSGCNLDVRDSKADTPLHCAVNATTTDPLKLLLK